MLVFRFQLPGYSLRRFQLGRIIFLALSLIVLPASLCAQFAYSTVGGAITITGYTGPGGAVTIPNTINGLPVTQIANAAFQNKDAVTSVTVPGSVTAVGNYAFNDCNALTNLVFEEGVISLGSNLCRSCVELTSVTLPNSLVSIGTQAFIFCYKLGEINLPRGVTSIGGAAGLFSRCNSLMAINVDALNPAFSSVDGILFNKDQSAIIKFPPGRGGQYAIPTNITSIEGTFESCSQLTNVVIPTSVVNIGGWAFDFCSGLKNILIPNGVTNLGYAAFGHCAGLTNITISDSVRRISDWAFTECGNLYSVTLPHAPSFGEYVFSYCPALRYLTFLGDAPVDYGSNLFYGDSGITIYCMPWATGWSTTFYTYPIKLWNPSIDSGSANFGIRTNRFGFTISGTSGLVVMVEASTNLSSPVWSRIRTNTLTGGFSYFGDAGWTNYSGRYYRLRWP